MKIPEALRDLGFQTEFIWGLGCGLFLMFLRRSFVSFVKIGESPMKPANGMRANAVKTIAAAIVGLLSGVAWLTAILYFSLTMEF